MLELAVCRGDGFDWVELRDIDTPKDSSPWLLGRNQSSNHDERRFGCNPHTGMGNDVTYRSTA